MEDKERIDELENLIKELNNKIENQKPKISVKKIIAIVLLCFQVVATIGAILRNPVFLLTITYMIGFFSFSIVALILLHIDFKQKRNVHTYKHIRSYSSDRQAKIAKLKENSERNQNNP